jgi:hypothetical protein
MDTVCKHKLCLRRPRLRVPVAGLDRVPKLALRQLRHLSLERRLRPAQMSSLYQKSTSYGRGRYDAHLTNTLKVRPSNEHKRELCISTACRTQTHHAALGLDESAQDEPVALLHAVGGAHAVRVRAPVLGGDDGQLPGLERAVGLDAVGEADHGAHGEAGGGRLGGLEPLRLPERDGGSQSERAKL